MKITNRDKYILVGLGIAILLYIFYMYIYVPLEEEKVGLQARLDELSPQVKDIDQLEIKLKGLEKRKTKLERDLKDLDSVKDFNEIPYEELLSYIGIKEKEYGIDVTSFTKMDLNNRGSYMEIPYEIKIEGDYQNIVKFINDLYELNKYFFIADIEMKENEVLPLEAVVQSEEKVEMPFDWAENFINQLNRGIPVESIIEKSEKMDPYTKEERIQRRIELSFKFYFVSLGNREVKK